MLSRPRSESEFPGTRQVIEVRVFVAGSTGVIGRRLVPQLVARGHQVTGTATSPARLGIIEQMGAGGVVMNGLDAASVGEAVAAARPDAIVHQMTGLSPAHAGKPNLRRPERFFAVTNRLRSEGTDHLVAAAKGTTTSCSWPATEPRAPAALNPGPGS
jgi:nucleoside-diphosphate-sugar epimerase